MERPGEIYFRLAVIYDKKKDRDEGVQERPLTGYQFSSPHFQTKDRELAVLSAKTESGWTTAHDGTACP